MAVDIKNAALLGAGAAAKGVVAGFVSRFFPGLGLGDEVIAILVGYIVADRTADGSIPNLLAKGVMIGGIAQVAKAPVERLAAGIIKKGEKAGSSESPSEGGSKSPSGSGNGKVDGMQILSGFLGR